MSINPVPDHPLDPYEILGVDPDASLIDIKRKTLKLLALRNPKGSSDEPSTARRFHNIQQAWETIKEREFQRKAGADMKRLRFLAFVMQAYDAREGLQQAERTAGDEEIQLLSQPSQSEENGDLLGSIEDEIRQRNRAFETLKGAGQAQSVHSSHQSPQETTRKEKLYAVPVEQLNLQIMNPHQKNALVDIVAVHGLGAIPDITWKERTSGINWLSDEKMLPSATPHARILRFGYDSLWMGKTPIRTSLSTIAYKLLLALSMSRMENLRRPLIFIGHCFGGLVIQRALNLAMMQRGAYPSVFDSTTGIVFLGTPHRGTQSFTRNSALFAAIAASSDLSQHLETGVLDSMTSENGALLDVTDDFLTICAENGPMITCFFEQRPSKLGKIVERDDITEFIVDQRSATLDGHRRYGLELDHFSLNKFDGPDNANYMQVRAEILRFYRAALQKVERESILASTHSSIRDILPSSSEPPFGNLNNRNTSRSSRRQYIGPNSGHANTELLVRGANPRTRPQTVVYEDEDDIRIDAMKELRKEEENKQRVLYVRETQMRLLEEKRIAEQHYLERLKRNMTKYGISNPDEILAVHPLPDDEDLSLQEINDKDKWHKSLIKQELLAAGLDGGQVDEVLHDTGEVMMIDDVETTFTKMAKKWISKRTLDKYNIPWQDDKNDASAIIIKRWVPDYERDFLWDHSQAIRDNRGRKPDRNHQPTFDNRRSRQNIAQPAQNKDWFSQIMDSFKDASDRNSANSTRKKDREERTVLQTRTRQRTRSVSPVIYTPRSSAPLSPPSLQRTGSRGSTHSAPDIHEVDRRRRHSRTLSHSRERPAIARSSGEFTYRSRRDGSDEVPKPGPPPTKHYYYSPASAPLEPLPQARQEIVDSEEARWGRDGLSRSRETGRIVRDLGRSRRDV